MKFRVVIVGSGASGLATAYNLALKGESSVAVLERGYACSGASTRNAAHFRVHFWAPENVRFAMESLQKFKEFASETRTDFEVRREGYLWLLTREEAVEAYRRTNNQLWSRYGVAGEFLSPEEMAERYPYLDSEGFIAGFFGSQDGKWNPNLISLAYYEKARDLGVKILTRTEAERIIIENGKVKGVQ
ncbi:MAG: NAD(P)/FAD-dependent oxidoreductase, partial [Candidatus Bathycorpusculaceae bacterium]